MLNQWKCSAPERARAAPDRARDNVDFAQAAPIKAGEDLSRPGDETLAHRRRKRAVNHDRLKVDNGDRCNRGIRQSRSRVFNPAVELRPEVAPRFGRRTNRRSVDTGRLQSALELIN